MLILAAVGLVATLLQQNRSPSVVQELEGLEHRLASKWKAGDCDAWGAMLAPEWSVTHITGSIMTRVEALQDCRAPRPVIEGLDIDDLKVRAYDNAAVVTGRTTVTIGGSKREVVILRFTDVFVRRSGQWLVVASHATRVVPE